MVFMDMLIELMIDLLFDAGLEVTKNKKINKWIRFPLILLILLYQVISVAPHFHHLSALYHQERQLLPE